jgi:hypothetical protein
MQPVLARTHCEAFKFIGEKGNHRGESRLHLLAQKLSLFFGYHVTPMLVVVTVCWLVR